jgi:hypothetical protein
MSWYVARRGESFAMHTAFGSHLRSSDHTVKRFPRKTALLLGTQCVTRFLSFRCSSWPARACSRSDSETRSKALCLVQSLQPARAPCRVRLKEGSPPMRVPVCRDCFRVYLAKDHQRALKEDFVCHASPLKDRGQKSKREMSPTARF